MIKKIELTKGAGIQFPFEIKDHFRKAFPSAKWNREARRWEVGPRSIKRLDQWIEEVNASGVLDEIAARDGAVMSLEEVQALRVEIERVRGEISAARSAACDTEHLRAESVALRTELDGMKEELAAARAELASAEAAAQEAEAEVAARVSHIATVAEIDSLRAEMKRNWVPKAHARPKFDAAQKELKRIRDEFGKIGIECQAVNLAAAANFNRRDRDFNDLLEQIHFRAA